MSLKRKLEEHIVEIAALLFVAMLIATCAMGCKTSPEVAVPRAVQTAAELGQVAREALQDVDAAKLDALATEAERTGNQSKARAAAAAWRDQLADGHSALKVYAAAVVAAKGAVMLAALGKFDLGKTLMELAQAYQALRQALTPFGINLPGGF